mgnify:CR=1 FL=1
MEKAYYFYFVPANAKRQFLLTKKTTSVLEGTYLMKDGRLLHEDEVDEEYCPKCFEELSYIEQFDAECCMECDEWRESACSDPNCGYCSGRPEKPSMYNEAEE